MAEPGYGLLQRQWARPTLDVVGMWGGFQGEGLKTIIPAAAHAKLSCRLVPDQGMDDILDKLEAHLRRVAPGGVELTIDWRLSGAPAMLDAGRSSSSARRGRCVDIHLRYAGPRWCARASRSPSTRSRIVTSGCLR